MKVNIVFFFVEPVKYSGNIIVKYFQKTKRMLQPTFTEGTIIWGKKVIKN